MPVQLTGYASVQPIEADERASSWKSPVSRQQDKAIRSLASAYESSYREEPRAASLIKAQWAWALLPGRSHACQPPKQISAKLAVAELVGVYFGLYCNPARDSVHKRLNRTLGDILREAPADDGSLLAMQLQEILDLQQPGGNLGQRAAIWGTKQDMGDLLSHLKQASCGSAGQVQALRRRCAQSGLDALLAYVRDTLHEAGWNDLENWPCNALTLIENDAILRTHEQLDTLALMSMLGHEACLMKRLPPAAFAPRKLFACDTTKRTLVQWLLRREEIAGRVEKLQFVLKHSAEPLWYSKNDLSPWLQTLHNDPSATLALEMLRVVGPYHRDCYTGATPLHLMASISDHSGAWSMLSALLTQGADPHARDDQGETALTALKDSPYARAVQAFPAWYRKIGPTVDKFCEATSTPPHVVVSLLLRHNATLDEEAAARVLTACCDIYDVGKLKLNPNHKVAFVRDAINWVRIKRGTEQQERLATLERMPSVAVGEKIFGCPQEPRGSEWRILRMVLSHMRKSEPQRYNSRMAVEVMDDICRSRKLGVAHLVHAVSDFRALPMTWFYDQDWSWSVAYKTLMKMFNLNVEFPGQRVSSAVARQVKKLHRFKQLNEPLNSQILEFEVNKLLVAVRGAAQGQTDDNSSGGFLNRVFEALDVFSSYNCSPLFDDDYTAEAIAFEATTEDARAVPPGPAPGDASQPLQPPPGAPAVSTDAEPQTSAPSPATVQTPPQVTAAPAPAPDNALLPVIAQGIEPLLRDLSAGRLAESDLQPLRTLAEATHAHPTLLRGPEPMFDRAIATLRATLNAADATGAQTANDVREHAALISGALHNEVLQGVILGTAGIGETERMQRATKRLVTRAFVQVLACALGDEFTLVYLSADSQARSAVLRKLMFRVAPDKCVWAQGHAETMHAIKELFQLVSGFKALCENQPQLERCVAATLRRAPAR